ncbi:ribosome maturation factor RimM [Reinekea marinisedimentorum]|uniref:Ribosome maturation factor RimM n=1 Tax=Reinekea marinisedimentorum TaxID=230495 RepID=A0A4R3I2K7_9GAMM|nr:ribosome maturation factor RimM [Reinekea marinisedimentorum]TCS40026.1 16S rRNA processing protein RimM [Reinekea marinisedimentorum]
MALKTSEDYVVLGKISSVYGVKGWVKVFSYTDPLDKILEYGNWILRQGNNLTQVEVDKGRSHGKGMVAHLRGIDDREVAKQYSGFEICVPMNRLPELSDGEYYWYQLEGLTVVTTDNVSLGVVDYMMSTGAGNDVLVVKGDAHSIDRRERLIPYVEQFVLDVSLDAGKIVVEWDPEF